MNMVKKLSASTPQLTGFPIDPVIVGISVFLMLYGLVMIGSASLEVGVKTYGNPFFLLTRHSIYLMVGGLAALILSNRWKQQVEEVKEALNELAVKHQQEQEQNKELKQKLADTRYQLGEAKKDLAARS